MKKYFITSDIHSFYDEFINGLSEAGYDKNNPDHILIINGDVFDRGFGSVELFEYLQTIPKDRLILIKGNHEELLLDILARWNVYKKNPDDYDNPIIYNYDYNNGTVRTIASFVGMNEWDLFDEEGQKTALAIFEHSKVVKWLKSRQWKNYLELGPYIITHSFIPLHDKNNLGTYDADYASGNFTYFDSWRTDAKKKEWEDARWGCPWKQYQAGLFNKEAAKDKILVCGHWHSSDFYTNLDNIFMKECPIYYGENIIAIDACTAVTHHINVLIINEDMTIEHH